MEPIYFEKIKSHLRNFEDKFNLSSSQNSKNKNLICFDLGIIEYNYAYNLQIELWELIRIKNYTGIILLLEHWPVITIGSNRNIKNIITPILELKKQNIEIYQSNRGGDVTFHGPGQLICYPIFNLEKFEKDLTKYVYNLEQIILETLSFFKITGHRIKKIRGVFVNNQKIASIGIHVKKWITYHGFSFNINVDLNYFKNIIACGLKDYPQTSLSVLLKKEITVSFVKDIILRNFEKVFNIKIIKNNYIK